MVSTNRGLNCYFSSEEISIHELKYGNIGRSVAINIPLVGTKGQSIDPSNQSSSHPTIVTALNGDVISGWAQHSAVSI